MRRFLVFGLTFMLLVPPGWAGSDGSLPVIDEGEGQFRIEAPVIVPSDTVRPKHGMGEAADFVEEASSGQGYVRVVVDTFPVAVNIDGQMVIIDRADAVLPIRAGRHFLSLFPVKDIYLVYRDETPAGFWQMIDGQEEIFDRFGLISSYEREAVRAGTRWVRLTPGDTADVRLSDSEVKQVYRRNAMATAITFFGVTAVIAAAMFGSVALISGE